MASLFKPAEWSLAMQRGATTLAAIGGIIVAYLAVESWAEDKITESERRVITEIATHQVRNEIDHDKMIQSRRIEVAQTNIRITELQMADVEDQIDEREEDGKQATERQDRAMDRLTKMLESYEAEQEDATSKLTVITRTTTTTTTTSNQPET